MPDRKGAPRAVPQRTRFAFSRRPEELEPRRLLVAGSVVINEIHYDPDIKTQAVEFVELHNPGDTAVDLSNAAFTKGIEYTFPAGTVLQPGGYVVVAENPTAFQAKYSTTALGPFIGSLANEGEEIEVEDATGNTLDEVDYGAGFPWPTVGDAPGYSIELINPTFDNNLGGNWRSVVQSQAGQQTLIATGSQWRYRKGTSEASSPDRTTWRLGSFVEDATWNDATLPIGYDPNVAIATPLSDMQTGYFSVFLRKTFTVSDPGAITALQLQAMYDDGFNVWINGQRVVNTGVTTDPLYNTLATSTRENAAFASFNLPIPATYLVAGTNTVAVQFHNVTNSSDAFFDARLLATTGGGVGPTPGRRNAAFAANAAPAMRQVSHTPETPAANQPVTITAKVTDPEGVASVVLSYQLVDPGNYIAKEDAAYSNPANWINATMIDNGTGGDTVAGDGTYTVVLPASVQQHRRLVRYRITSTDGLGASITGPYTDDPTPNFAYYVYNGIPSYSGAAQPGATGAKGQVVTYPAASLSTVPVYQLITKRQDHLEAQHLPGATTGGYTGDNYPWSGTLVYGGKIYDHVHYRARGGVWRYAMGKNMWKFDFNRGNEFQAYDAYGNAYPEKWTKLNLGANIQQGDIGRRGEQGLFEGIGFELFNLAGVPGPYTTPIHFRIVENSSETGDSANQYDDDFQGLYLAVEQPNGRLLDAHGLPDGNLYKMEGGTGTLNNQGPTHPTDRSDLDQFLSRLKGAKDATYDQWVRDNIDLDALYRYQAVVEFIHHYDIGFGKNYFYYHNPETNKWSVVPWDLDLTWWTSYSPGGGNMEDMAENVLARPVFQAEYKNVAREVRNLLWQNDQIAQLADAYAAIINPASLGGVSLANADRAMWDYNPIMMSSSVNTNKAGHGRYYATGVPTQDFPGMVAKLKSWASDRGTWFDTNQIADASIPVKPTVSFIGAAGFHADDLRFRSSNFAGNNGGTFAGMQWRIAEYSDAANPTYAPADPKIYEVETLWATQSSAFDSDVTVPTSTVEPGHTYRVRVRMQDNTGRWSDWSNPLQFVATSSLAPPEDAIRITEVMYHPANAPGNVPPDDNFEFVELHNISGQSVNVGGMEFVRGFDMVLADATLAPGEYAVVVRNRAAFESRYGTSIRILGEWGAQVLDNGGERITLATAANFEFHDFTYDDVWYPQTDGPGRSLVILDPTAPLATWSSSTAWRASTFDGGSPGAADPVLTPPVVQSVVINDGHAQRSSITSITVTFNQPVALDADAFSLVARDQGSGFPDVTLMPASSDGGVTWVITFTGTSVIGDSLPEGIYDLTIVAARVHAGSLAGPAMTADHGTEFHRLFSDADGDGDSDNADLFQMRGTYGKFENDPAYRWWFDYDSDGDVDNADVFQVRSRRAIVFQGY